MKKMTAILLSAMVLCTATGANAEVYYEKKETTAISNGVTHSYINQYTDSGWQKIHVIEADLTTPFVKADILTHKDGIGFSATVPDLAENAGSLAAVNSDFFARNSWTKASTIGLVVENGELKSTASKEINGATIGFDGDNNVLLDYITTNVVFTAANGNSISIKEINKYDSLKEPVIYTKDFAAVTAGSYDNVLEVVVVDGVVTEMRRNMDGVAVPENGYVIRHLPEYNTFLWENVQVGDHVTLNVNTSVDISALQSACGGGTLLIKDGQKHKNTHNIGGVNPRTIAGTDSTGKKLFLVTVDGRKGDAAGMTMSNLQDLALSLGMYTAINLDGGGSTTMVARNVQTGKREVVNTPSDGGLRTVPIGLQILSTAPEGEPAATLVLKTEDEKVFAGSTRSFMIDYALDPYGNPCAVPQEEAVWQASAGSFTGNVFHADAPGKVTITATAGGASGSMEITVLDKPSQLKSVPMSVYADQDFAVYGTDKNGYTAKIEKADCQAEDMGKYRRIRFGDAEGAVYLNENNADTFEGGNGSASAYPSGSASASYAMTSDFAVSGAFSGKLSFHFPEGGETKAAYLNFAAPKNIPENAAYLGVWVYAPQENYQWLRAEGLDASGQVKRITLSESMAFSGWQYLTAPIPSDMKTITKLYVVQNEKQVALDSFVCFDNLEFLTENQSLPVYRAMQMYAPVQNSEFTLTVTSEQASRWNLLSGLYDAELEKHLKSSYADCSVALGHKTASEIGTNSWVEFGKGENGGAVLAVNKSGITGADSSQWSKLKALLQKPYKNIFLSIPVNPKDLPNRQGEVFENLLLEKAGSTNIFVFLPGTVNEIYKRDGITYVTVSGLKYINGSVLIDQFKYMSFAKVTVENGEAAVTFEKVYAEE